MNLCPEYGNNLGAGEQNSNEQLVTRSEQISPKMMDFKNMLRER